MHKSSQLCARAPAPRLPPPTGGSALPPARLLPHAPAADDPRGYPQDEAQGHHQTAAWTVSPNCTLSIIKRTEQ